MTIFQENNKGMQAVQIS